jgi:2,4-dienoyl-CoA reductase-like NADH-dependent reductase (Old Yellow Enzyme family)
MPALFEPLSMRDVPMRNRVGVSPMCTYSVEARDGVAGPWHVDALRPVTAAISEQGAVPAVQLAHAGRKAGTYRPFDEARGVVPVSEGGWTPVGPTALPFRTGDPAPEPLDEDGIAEVVAAFAAAAERAVAAGFRVIEVPWARHYGRAVGRG